MPLRDGSVRGNSASIDRPYARHSRAIETHGCWAGARREKTASHASSRGAVSAGVRRALAGCPRWDLPRVWEAMMDDMQPVAAQYAEAAAPERRRCKRLGAPGRDSNHLLLQPFFLFCLGQTNAAATDHPGAPYPPSWISSQRRRGQRQSSAGDSSPRAASICCGPDATHQATDSLPAKRCAHPRCAGQDHRGDQTGAAASRATHLEGEAHPPIGKRGHSSETINTRRLAGNGSQLLRYLYFNSISFANTRPMTSRVRDRKNRTSPHCPKWKR